MEKMVLTFAKNNSVESNESNEKRKQTEDPHPLFWLGIVLAVIGNILISVGLFLQKKVHIKNKSEKSYLHLPEWWLGVSIMGCGEIGNFIAYGMAPAVVVSPLGGINVILNFLLCKHGLREKSSWKGVWGIITALVGSILIVLNAPHSSEIGQIPSHEKNESLTLASLLNTTSQTITKKQDFIYNCIISWRSFAFFSIIFSISLFLANPLGIKWAVSSSYFLKRALFCCIICSFAGAVTVTSAKGISTALILAFSGDPAMFLTQGISWLTYVLFLCIGCSLFTQVKFLNKALMYFQSNVVVPTYYILFTTTIVAVGTIIFLEIHFSNLEENLALFITGLLLAFSGVYMISSQNIPIEISSNELDEELMKMLI
jgi:hypothetical protein